MRYSIRLLPRACVHYLTIGALLILMSAAVRADGRAAYPADALVFLSTEVIDHILSAGDNTDYRVPGVDQLSVRLLRLRSAFDEQPGLLRADLEATLSDDQAPLTLTAGGRLVTEYGQDGRLLLRPRLTSLIPRRSGDTLDDALHAVAASTIQTGLNALADSAPALDFQLQRRIDLQHPAGRQALSFRLGDARVQARLQVPALAIALQVSTRSLHYSANGLFALLTIAPPTANAAIGSPPDSTAPDLATLAAIVPAGQTAFIHIQGHALERLVMSLNGLPPPSRTLSLVSEGSQGKLFSRKRLGLGCGSSARLAEPAGLVGGMSLGAIRAHWGDGRIGLELPLWVDLRARAGVKVNGFPAPCGLTSPRPRCRCARGKTHFPVHTRLHEAVGVIAEVGFGGDGDGGVDYRLRLRAPHELRLKPRLSLGRLGSLPIPVTLPMPIGELARGSLPLLLRQSGRIRLGLPPTVTQDYRLRLDNTLVQADQIGLGAGFALSLNYARSAAVSAGEPAE